MQPTITHSTPADLTKRIPVFFNEAQLHDPCSYSKSPLKPGLLASRIATDEAFELKSSLIGPVTPERLMQTHEKRYIDGLMEGTIADGFGNKSKKDFKAIRTTVGNFLIAAEWAVAGRREGNPETDIIHPGVVWSLTSGFHHANPGHAEGFCTVEALTLAAYELWKYRKLRTLIVDMDFHRGDGCEEMISMHQMEGYCDYMQSDHTHVHPDLAKFRAELERRIAIFNPDAIFYQAGADMWIGDPLGGSLTMLELYQRDLIVFHLAKLHGIPVVCNLAGGYAENYEHTLQIHMNTGEAMKEVYLGYGAATVPIDAM